MPCRYDSDVQTVFEDGDLTNKAVLDDYVRAVRPGSTTNLYAGLQRAAELLQVGQDEREDSLAFGARPIKRIFLFSDGMVNCGVQAHQEIFRGVARMAAVGITVSTFGIGADFDEPLMKVSVRY